MSSLMIFKDGEQSGPFTEEEIRRGLREGTIIMTTLAWKEGMKDWASLSTFSEFKEADPIPETKSDPNSKKSILAQIQEFVCAVSGLNPLTDFRLFHLYSNAFKSRSQAEVDMYFNCGCDKTTPLISEVSSEWPKPWYFLRLLLYGALVLVGFWAGFAFFGNPKFIPGIMIVGAFFVPISCVVLFYEMNVPRNIPFQEVLKVVVGGGILSLLGSMVLYSMTDRPLHFLGAMSAGLVEELAKVLTAVIILRGAARYKWILNGILIGSAVGAGFAGFESAGYIFVAFLDDFAAARSDFSEFYYTLLGRAFFAPFCHVIWTAIVVGALWRVKKDKPFHFSMLLKSDFLRILFFVMALHMLWNSGLESINTAHLRFWKVELYLWTLSIVGSWYLVLLLIQEGLQQIKNALPPRSS